MAETPVHPDALGALVRQVVAQVRWRRAEHGMLRGLFYGGAAGVLALALKVVLGGWASLVAGGLVAAGVLAGGLWGFARRVTATDAARLADRAFGLQDRVATALECAGRPYRTALVDALVADASARVRDLPPRQIVRRIVPREARWLPAPVLAAAALLLAPPLPLPGLPDLSPSAGGDEVRERPGEEALTQRDLRALPKEAQRRPFFEERDFFQRGAAGASPTAGDLSAVFKDTALSAQRPDFNSFLKKGDERLKLLEQVDRLPDLQSDFTQSQYRMVFRKAKALTGGLRPDQLSPEKLRELLEEMQRLGRKDGGNGWGPEVAEGMDALEAGQTDRALEAMQKALDKLRAMEAQERSGKGLRGGREGGDGLSSRDRGAGGAGPDDQDFGEGEGLLPGKGKSPQPKGEASQRLRATPYDAGVEGESRKGRKEAYDTNMTGQGARVPSRLGYLGVLGRYRKMMEDAITREQIPRDYHAQIKQYFEALDER